MLKFVDLSEHSRIKVSGDNASGFLHSVCTNEIKSLKSGGSVGAAFADRFGKTIGLASIHNLGDFFILESDKKSHGNLFSYISRMGSLSDCNVFDLGKTHGMFSVFGKQNNFLPQRLDSEESSKKILSGSEAIVLKNCFLDRVDIVFLKEDEEKVMKLLNENPATEDAKSDYKNFRIENGFPEYGIDFDQTYLVVELGLENIINYNKGCYTGQEIIARMKNYSAQLSKKVVNLEIQEGQKIAEEERLFSGDDEVGSITSAGTKSCLGTIKKGFFESRTELKTKNNSKLIVA